MSNVICDQCKGEWLKGFYDSCPFCQRELSEQPAQGELIDRISNLLSGMCAAEAYGSTGLTDFESESYRILNECLTALQPELIGLSVECVEYIESSLEHELACSMAHQEMFPRSRSNNRHLELQQKFLEEIKQAK